MVKQAWLVTLFPVLWACTDVADDRAEHDESIGHYDNGEVRIDVDDGLAVIREATADYAVFWSSAPVWTATVQTAFSRSFDVELRNIIAGSTLIASGSNGDPFSVTLEEEPLPTRRRFRVNGPSGRLRLQIIPPNSSETFRFAVLSDIQKAVTEVQDIFRRIAAEPNIEFVLSAGDLTDRGKWSQVERFEDELKSLPIPFYATIGNHDIFYDCTPYQRLFGRVNLHFHYRGAAFTLVDSASATIATRVDDWLNDWLDDDHSRVHLFATHVPLIDPIGIRGGGFASQIEAHRLIAKLADGRVDAAFYGHIHSYYKYDTAGIPSYISGGGGGRPEILDGVGRHFLVVDINKNRVESVRKIEVDE
jgi:predicted phosphodiesterase